jgi:hypothetical protein
MGTYEHDPQNWCFEKGDEEADSRNKPGKKYYGKYSIIYRLVVSKYPVQ